jgi:Spherulation-specific family 4
VVVFLPVQASGATQAAQGNTGLIVPLYGYPSPVWNSLIQAKAANPSVPVVAVINPDGGPGWSLDQNFVTGIRNLQAAGIIVLGYVWTDYGSRPLNETEADIHTYWSWYGVNGTYLDQMASWTGEEAYYSAANVYAKSLGMTLTVGNAGTDVAQSYIGTVDVIIVYESPGLPSISSIGGWHADYPKSDFGMIAYGVGTVNNSYIADAAYYLGYLYITDAGSFGSQYFPLPSYLSTETEVLASMIPQQVQITVNSETLNGTGIPGLWVVDSSTGGTTTGFTPTSFTGNEGAAYSFSVSNYGNFVFDHWSDGSHNPTVALTATQSVTLTAYFRQANSLPANTSGTSSTTSTTITTGASTAQAPQRPPVPQSAGTTTSYPSGLGLPTHPIALLPHGFQSNGLPMEGMLLPVETSGPTPQVGGNSTSSNGSQGAFGSPMARLLTAMLPAMIVGSLFVFRLPRRVRGRAKRAQVAGRPALPLSRSE